MGDGRCAGLWLGESLEAANERSNECCGNVSILALSAGKAELNKSKHIECHKIHLQVLRWPAHLGFCDLAR